METDWNNSLHKWSVDILERVSESIYEKFPGNVKKEKWLGGENASFKEIRIAETKLSIKLADSEKGFWRSSDGWKGYYPEVFELYPVLEIKKFAPAHPDLLESWQSGIDISLSGDEIESPEKNSQEPFMVSAENLKEAIEIGKAEDDQYILLFPKQNTTEASEIWLFATWYPGAYRYGSLFSLLTKLHEDLLATELKRRNITRE